MVRTSSSTRTSTSFSSRPGSSAETRTSVGRDHLEARPGEACARTATACRVEAVEHVVEEPVHLAMQRQERARLLAAASGSGPRSRCGPRGSDLGLPLSPPFVSIRRAAPFPRAFARGLGASLRFGLGRLGSSRLVLDLLGVVLPDGLRPAGRDLDPARLQSLGDLALQARP